MKLNRAEKAPMKRSKKILLWVAAAIIALTVIVIAVTALVNHMRVTTLVNQQNYVASKLIEMGSYEEGRQLAMKSEQTRTNNTSRTLIVLAAGFSSDVNGGIRAAEIYLADGKNTLLSDTLAVLQTVRDTAMGDMSGYDGGYTGGSYVITLDETARNELLTILLEVQRTIQVKKTGAAVQAMQEILSTGAIQTVTEDALAKDTSLLSHKVQTLSAINRGEYDKAFSHAETLFRADSSFENRAMLANLVATGYIAIDGDTRAIEKQQEELDRLYMALNEAYDDYYVMLDTAYDESKQKSMYDEILRIEGEIASVQAQRTREVVKRAINFIETGTPITQKHTAPYVVELSYLYFSAGNDEKAADLLSDYLTATEPAAMDAVSIALSDMVTHYRSAAGGAGRTEEREMVWNRIASILGIQRDPFGENPYFAFLEDLLNRIYKSLVIRAVDASDFPTVRVTVNAATDEGGNLKKNDFIVTDMDQSVGGIRILDADDLEITADMSVMLVIDRSGSMDGMPMEHTKAAVMNFVKNTDPATAIGCVTFESQAELVAPLGASRTQLLAAVDALYTTGGTNIKDGLAVAGEALSGAHGRRIVILISDGSDGSPDGIDAVLENLRLQNICVYTIAFGGADTRYLSYIADATGGKFLQSDSSAGLEEIYSEIGEYMVNDYVLEFDAQTSLEDFSRDLSITLRDIHAMAESIYYVGVPLENILDEEGLVPAYDAYRQIGGSASGH